MAKPWSEAEVEAIVADYLSMLGAEVRGQPFNKAAHNRALLRSLDHRERTSVEFKHRNITAVLHDLGYPGIEGYKPLSNYQGLLRDVVLRKMLGDESLRRLVARRVEAEVEPGALDEQKLQLAEPPKLEHAGIWVAEPRLSSSRVKRSRVNYLEREARNASMGKAGEMLVLRFEQQRLIEAGCESLAKKVERVSETRGDREGYDIHSFEADKEERLIEVKTTGFGRETPFFVSRHEVAFSTARAKNYYLYRVFHLPKAPQLYTVRGALSESFRLVPEVFSGRVA